MGSKDLALANLNRIDLDLVMEEYKDIPPVDDGNFRIWHDYFVPANSADEQEKGKVAVSGEICSFNEVLSAYINTYTYDTLTSSKVEGESFIDNPKYNGDERVDSKSSNINFVEYATYIPAKSIYVPLKRNIYGWFVDEYKTAPGIVDTIQFNDGIACQFGTKNSLGYYYFSKYGVNTTNLRYIKNNFKDTKESFGGKCSEESILGATGHQGFRYSNFRGFENKFYRYAENFNIFKILGDGTQSTERQTYQISFYARAKNKGRLTLSIDTSPSGRLPYNVYNKVDSSNMRCLSNSTLTETINNRTIAYCPIDESTEWKAYWIHFTLTNDTGVNGVFEKLYFMFFFSGDSLDISDIRLTKSEGSYLMPNYLYDNDFTNKVQKLQLALSPVLPVGSSYTVPDYITFRVNRYSRFNKVCVQLFSEGNLYDEYHNVKRVYIDSSDTDEGFSIYLIKGTGQQFYAYAAYMVTDRCTKFLGYTEDVIDPTLSVWAIDENGKTTSIAICDVIACFNKDAKLRISDIHGNVVGFSYTKFRYKEQLIKVKTVDSAYIPEKTFGEDECSISSTNIIEKKIKLDDYSV